MPIEHDVFVAWCHELSWTCCWHSIPCCCYASFIIEVLAGEKYHGSWSSHCNIRAFLLQLLIPVFRFWGVSFCSAVLASMCLGDGHHSITGFCCCFCVQLCFSANRLWQLWIVLFPAKFFISILSQPRDLCGILFVHCLLLLLLFLGYFCVAFPPVRLKREGSLWKQTVLSQDTWLLTQTGL